MKPIVTFWHRLVALMRRRRLERDLDDELAFHLAMREAEYRQAGSPADVARAQARRRFGSLAHARELARDAWIFRPLDTVTQDVRYAWRTLRRSPGFSLVAVLALAIGIGGNTAMFSLLDAIQTRRLPYPEPDRLVALWGTVQRAGIERRGTSYPDYLDWRSETRSFEDLAAFDNQMLTLGIEGEDPERINTEFVSASYFSLLGMPPARGRTFRVDEDQVARPVHVVVVSDGLWKRRLGADTAILGRRLALNGDTYDVIGVMPPGFRGVTDQAELWVPFAGYSSPANMAARGNRGFLVLGRLKRRVTLAAARNDATLVARRLELAHPDTNAKRGIEVTGLDEQLFGPLRPALWMLMTAVSFVMLIACANVANLLLARSDVRRRELAVRSAIGAGRGRIVRQLLTEACVLTTLGAAAGLLVARAAIGVLLAHSPIAFPSFVAPHIDGRVAAFTIAVSCACGVLIGLAPGCQSRDDDLADALRESARASGGRRAGRLRSALIVAEVALAVVLLVGAGLMIQSVRRIVAIDPGFDPESVLTLHVSIPRGRASGAEEDARVVTEVRDVIERVRAVPGVTAAAFGTDVPLDGRAAAGFYSPEGHTPIDASTFPRAYVHMVSPGFFATLRVPFVAGRTFEESETKPGETAVIVSERVARRFWPGADPIGRRLRFGTSPSGNSWFAIVGVVGEVKYRGLPDNPTADPDIYLPFVDRHSQVALAVRAAASPSVVLDAIRAAIHSVDRAIPIYGVATLEESIGEQTARSRFTTWLMGVFAMAALLLSVVGIYGVMSYLVTQRTREIGIRVALGASAREILRLVIGSGARLIAAGIALGVGAAFGLQRLVATLLFGVTTADGASVVAVVVLGAVALLACYIPAVRAARLDPLDALRYE